MHIHRIQIHIKQMHSKTSQRQRMQPIENVNDEWVGICPFPTLLHVIVYLIKDFFCGFYDAKHLVIHTLKVVPCVLHL